MQSSDQEPVKKPAKKLSELEKIREEFDYFLYIISHDLHAPLRHIRMFMDILKEELDEHVGTQLPEDAKSAMDSVFRASARLENQLNDLLTVSRIGTKEILIEEFDLKETVKSCLETLKGRIADTKAEFEYDSLSMIIGDKELIDKVFLALIENTLIHKKEDVAPKVTLSMKGTIEEWEISVSDNGVAINNEHLEDIFKLFKKLSHQELSPGSGVGLTISKKIIELHEGTIRCESTPGEGTTFLINLPKNF